MEVFFLDVMLVDVLLWYLLWYHNGFLCHCILCIFPQNHLSCVSYPDTFHTSCKNFIHVKPCHSPNIYTSLCVVSCCGGLHARHGWFRYGAWWMMCRPISRVFLFPHKHTLHDTDHQPFPLVARVARIQGTILPRHAFSCSHQRHSHHHASQHSPPWPPWAAQHC